MTNIDCWWNIVQGTQYEKNYDLLMQLHFVHFLVYIWDDVQKKLVIELTFGCPVMSVRMRREKYVVTCKCTL